MTLIAPEKVTKTSWERRFGAQASHPLLPTKWPLPPDRPGADAGALAPMSLAALALMSLADLLCAAAPVSLAILALMSLADLLCAVAASAWSNEPDLGSGIEFLRDPADSGSLRPVDRPGADAGTLACPSLALADPIVALAGSNEPDLGSRRLRG